MADEVGVPKEPKNKIKFGSYSQGSRSEYYLKLVREAQFLSQPLSEEEIVDLLTSHFPNKIRRGILNGNLRAFDDVEAFLKRIDESYENFRDGRGSMETRAESNSIATEVVFNRNRADLISDNEDDTPSHKIVLPVIEIIIEGVRVDVLVDSGSQISCISAEFLEELLVQNNEIERLRFNSMTVTGAIGNKKCVVSEQVYLSVIILNDTQVDVTCIIVPGLSRKLILGCDFLT
nr:unnamed protein product [Callosobruchus chinensis]